MDTFANVKSICQEAFYLIRQDGSVFDKEDNWTQGTPIEVAKCKLALSTAAGEVLDAFTWTSNPTPTEDNVGSWNRRLRNALVYCLARELAIPVAGRIEDMKNLDALYLDKLMQAKIFDLTCQLATNSDPVLAQLVGNFNTQDTALVQSYKVYTQRSRIAKEDAVREIQSMHDWRNEFVQTDESHPAYSAWIDLVCSKLAAACGLDANHVQLYLNKYTASLQAARAHDLEDAKAEIADADTRSVLAMISTNFVAGDAEMPRSITKITDRIDQLKESARREVLLAQDWNFAKGVDVFGEPDSQLFDAPPSDPYRFSVPYPAGALRLVGVYTLDGSPSEWKVENGMVRSRKPVMSIKYTDDVTDFTAWSAFARDAYIHRLAADVARTVMNNPQDAQLQEQKYQLALENAKLRDTRESSTPTDAWGDNFYADRMMGCGVPSIDTWPRVR